MPIITPQISLGNVINILSMFVVVAVAWTNVSNIANANSDDIFRLDRSAAEMEVRVRTLENNQSRADERLTNIIEKRLEGMDGK